METKYFILEELDIYSKRTYHDKYWDKIPVLIYNNQELLWPFDSQKIQEFLDLFECYSLNKQVKDQYPNIEDH